MCLWYNVVMVVATLIFVPFCLELQNAYNYYDDYVTGLLEPDPPNLFDFIVGQLCTLYCCSLNSNAMDWAINYSVLCPSWKRFSWSGYCQPTLQE